MKQTKLLDGTPVFCLKIPEAKMLDSHVDGYLKHGIKINDGNTVLDMGANVGVFGLRAIQKGKNVIVHCFEPIPDISIVLKKNAEVFGDNRWFVHEFGISSVADSATFTYFPNTPALSTLHPEQWEENPGAFKEAVKGTMKNPPKGMKWMKWIPTVFSGFIADYLVKGSKKVTCKLNTLSYFIEKENLNTVDLLKVDCEGAEMDVLKGIKDSHWPLIQSIVIEVHDVQGRLDEIKSLLTSKGFSKLIEEREQGLEMTPMYNLFAMRK